MAMTKGEGVDCVRSGFGIVERITGKVGSSVAIAGMQGALVVGVEFREVAEKCFVGIPRKD